MPPLIKSDAKKPASPNPVEEPKSIAKPQQTSPTKDEDRIDFVNVKDLIKGMEKQTNKDPKDTNGFLKRVPDNGQESDAERKMEELECDRREEKMEKADSCESTECSLSRSNSLINGVPVQAPKPLPRSSISEAGSMEEHSEAPKPKPRTTSVQLSGYKVTYTSQNVIFVLIFCFIFIINYFVSQFFFYFYIF